MMKCIAIFFVFGVGFVSSQNWLTNSYILNYEEYFTKVMQETVQELERQEWCNLKLDNVHQTVSDSLYNFLVNGTVVYSNGFLISIQKINVVNIQNSFTARAENDGVTNTAFIRGRLDLNDALVGFDVETTLNNDGVISVQKTTGTYNYLLIQFDFQIIKNINTGEVSVASLVTSLNAATGTRMIYLPANNVTEALSRRWIPSITWDSVARWGSGHMVPIILNIISTHLPIPDICIGCYA